MLSRRALVRLRNSHVQASKIPATAAHPSRQHDTAPGSSSAEERAAARPATHGQERRSTVFLSTKEEEEKEPTSYYHDLEANNDDRDEERRRLRLKQGKLLPRDPWGPGEFVSSCALQERPLSRKMGRAADRAESTEKVLRRSN